MVEQHADTDETRPLLADESSLRTPACSQQKKFMILTMCAIFVLAAEIGTFVSLAPETAIYERIICRNQGILSDSVDTPLVGVPPANPNDPCKSESVQAELALIKGYKDMFEVLPSILLSLPYGVLSDHWGRKPVLLLGIVGIVLGEMWIRLVALVMVADVFSEEERTTALFRLQSCAIVAEILATPLSAWLMQFDYWLPYTLGFFIIVLGCTPSLFLPDTLQEAKANKARWLEVANAASGETCDTVHIDGNVADANIEAPAKRSVLQEFVDQTVEFVRSTQFIWRNISVLLIVLSLLVAMLSRSSSIVLIQYVSKRFHWSIARRMSAKLLMTEQSSLLISIRGVFTLLNYLVIMPGVSFAATQYLNMHGARRDYNITLGSGILMVLGFGLIGLAPLPPFLILGVITLSLSTAFSITARSLVTSLVAPDHVGTLYSAITISQSIGILVAGPLFAYLFRTGLHLGGGWMGLPFVQAGLLSFIATVAVTCVRVPSPTCPAVEEEEHLLP
ncbi:hypothetical protein N7539_002342 [Penicillium diatomitis]|uniref:Major facilitator superfamily (MFS) profile domain-containing protein n=1 Tax=Penicillium diatomitis TaxID=2819901 RepID=A0A9W9XEH8_9EURO|nr:uncharacterized protein N7539_002342 [Penicillium diatomitis]KAJ5490775.1 hypothetical protein N7539_002342 [Penicillium diatomitis]